MTSSLIQRHQQVYAPVIAWDSDVEIVSAQGCWVTDVEGERYLDFASGIASINAGHCPPALVAAARDQLERLWHAVPAFPTRSEVWLKLMEEYGL